MRRWEYSWIRERKFTQLYGMKFLRAVLVSSWFLYTSLNFYVLSDPFILLISKRQFLKLWDEKWSCSLTWKYLFFIRRSEPEPGGRGWEDRRRRREENRCGQQRILLYYSIFYSLILHRLKIYCNFLCTLPTFPRCRAVYHKCQRSK